jgi:hypothetical protein
MPAYLAGLYAGLFPPVYRKFSLPERLQKAAAVERTLLHRSAMPPLLDD